MVLSSKAQEEGPSSHILLFLCGLQASGLLFCTVYKPANQLAKQGCDCCSSPMAQPVGLSPSLESSPARWPSVVLSHLVC